MNENLFGEPYEADLKKTATIEENKKRRWENAFQKWSNKKMLEDSDHYGACGFGRICDYCADNSYGRPCVRALNEMLRKRRKTIDYDSITFMEAFDGEV